jgi:hypothetical protein
VAFTGRGRPICSIVLVIATDICYVARMTRVVLAGSSNASSIAVIDFTTPSAPTGILVNPVFGEVGCTVGLSGARGAIGSRLGPPAKMRTIHVSDPASPTLGINLPVELAGIGAMAVDPTETYMAVGERNGSRVVLFDIQHGTPAVTVTTELGQIASVGFCSPKFVVVAGQAPKAGQESKVGLVDFSVSPPHVVYIKPGMGSSLTAACWKTLVAIGDNTSSTVKLYEVSNPTTAKAQTANGPPGGTSSIGLSGLSALCGTTSGEDAYLIDFANGTAEKFLAHVGSGPTVNREGADGVCGGGASGAVALFDLAANPPTLLGALGNSGLPSIQSIAVSSF